MEVGKIYSSKTIFEFADKNGGKIKTSGPAKGGQQAIHIELADQDLWFVMDKKEGFNGEYYCYKLIYNE